MVGAAAPRRRDARAMFRSIAGAGTPERKVAVAMHFDVSMRVTFRNSRSRDLAQSPYRFEGARAPSKQSPAKDHLETTFTLKIFMNINGFLLLVRNSALATRGS